MLIPAGILASAMIHSAWNIFDHVHASGAGFARKSGSAGTDNEGRGGPPDH